ncbi:MAG TPA: hypothetical protein VF276_19305 [Chloroflexia bacterium]
MESLDFTFIVITIVMTVGAAGIAAALYRRYVPAAKARIRVVAIYWSAGGNLLDVRYQVTRPGRVLPLDEIAILGADGRRAGTVAQVTRIGPLASRSALRRTGGFVLFRNASGVARGDRVIAVVGRGQQEAFTVT